MIEIGYWKIRGLVGGIRVLLEHVGEEWKESQYEAHFKDDLWDRSEWQNIKKSEEVQSKFAFPNIPWMKDGDVCLSQSTAILKVFKGGPNARLIFNIFDFCVPSDRVGSDEFGQTGKSVKFGPV